jgi:hypothetical protein
MSFYKHTYKKKRGDVYHTVNDNNIWKIIKPSVRYKPEYKYSGKVVHVLIDCHIAENYYLFPSHFISGRKPYPSFDREKNYLLYIFRAEIENYNKMLKALAGYGFSKDHPFTQKVIAKIVDRKNRFFNEEQQAEIRRDILKDEII